MFISCVKIRKYKALSLRIGSAVRKDAQICENKESNENFRLHVHFPSVFCLGFL